MSGEYLYGDNMESIMLDAVYRRLDERINNT
jgi:hypothetical protein